MNKGFANVVNKEMLKLEQKYKAEKQATALISRMQTIDKSIIALGRLGMKKDAIKRYLDEFIKAEQDFCETVLSDDDKEMWVSSEQIDRVIFEYVDEGDYPRYNERYNVK